MIYSNILKFVYYLISCCMGEILISLLVPHCLAGARADGNPAAHSANLVTDGAPALALGSEGRSDIVTISTPTADEPLINRSMLTVLSCRPSHISLALSAFAIGGGLT